ncbi:methyltransferase domain-containing protein [Kutzneria viridogrisea]|uniref:SAM-dependent methyltransferase n=1 Tax=Kutzneria viridogrisea TaxID=47990 RepID=A0ABR6BCU0_9PSEU|nr:SAM-dependent methyltransferase [Kutzneria viridogrisea]
MYENTAALGFDNNSAESVNQHRVLSEMLDAHTTSALAGTGVGQGWRCWDIGAGGGSISRWLAARGAEVLATDIKPQHVTGDFEIRQHNVREDPVPVAEFDLIHARLVLMHLPERETVLRKLAGALKPGGTLVLGEFLCPSDDLVRQAPDERSARLVRKFNAAMRVLVTAAGCDWSWAARVPEAMREAGLERVEVSEYREDAAGGSPAMLLNFTNSHQLGDQLVAVGEITQDELTALRPLLLDPRLVARSYLLLTTVGRRPAAETLTPSA